MILQPKQSLATSLSRSDKLARKHLGWPCAREVPGGRGRGLPFSARLPGHPRAQLTAVPAAGVTLSPAGRQPRDDGPRQAQEEPWGPHS